MTHTGWLTVYYPADMTSTILPLIFGLAMI